jgi:hypothetical protein
MQHSITSLPLISQVGSGPGLGDGSAAGTELQQFSQRISGTDGQRRPPFRGPPTEVEGDDGAVLRLDLEQAARRHLVTQLLQLRLPWCEMPKAREFDLKTLVVKRWQPCRDKGSVVALYQDLVDGNQALGIPAGLFRRAEMSGAHVHRKNKQSLVVVKVLPTSQAETIVLADKLKRLDVTLGTFLPIKKAGGAEFSLPEFCAGEMWTGLGTTAATPLPSPLPHQASAGLLLRNSAGGMLSASAGSAQPVTAVALTGNDDSWEDGSEGEAEVSSAQKRACIRPST